MFSDLFAQIEFRLNRFTLKLAFTISVPALWPFPRSTIDKGIIAATRFLPFLLTRRNVLVPIFLLPPEILAQVFHLLVLEEPPFSGNQNLGWIRVTHVCWSWRRVALDDSTLWAKIWGIPTNEKWISEILARAKNAALNIELNAAVQPSQTVLLTTPSHLPRTSQFRCHNLSTPLSNTILEICSSEAPALEHFELTVYSSPFTLPDLITLHDLGEDMLFKGNAPKLRTFSLSGIVIPWSLIPRGQLTQLKMACTKDSEIVGSRGDFNQLIDLLANCPSLKILALEFCLPLQLAESPRDRTIYLSHLSRLHLCGSTSRIANMLKILKLPSSTTLRLNTYNESSLDSVSEGLLLPVISAHFRSPAPIGFKSLAVSIQHLLSSSLSITASSFPSTLQNRPTRSFKGGIVDNPELVLSFNGLSNPGHSTDLLKQAFKMLPISNLESISMSASENFDVDWVELFGCCKSVTTMLAIGPGTSNLLQALTATVVTNAGSSEDGRKWNHYNRESTVAQPAGTMAHVHAAIFPELKILGLSGFNSTFNEGKFRPLLVGMPFDHLERGLQQRTAASGAPLVAVHCGNERIIEDDDDSWASTRQRIQRRIASLFGSE